MPQEARAHLVRRLRALSKWTNRSIWLALGFVILAQESQWLGKLFGLEVSDAWHPPAALFLALFLGAFIGHSLGETLGQSLGPADGPKALWTWACALMVQSLVKTAALLGFVAVAFLLFDRDWTLGVLVLIAAVVMGGMASKLGGWRESLEGGGAGPNPTRTGAESPDGELSA